jgi:hypothetical protein
MALKRWAVPSCPRKNLVDGTSNWWTDNAGGTNEYYYNQPIFDHIPNTLLIDGSVVGKSSNAPNSLTEGQWTWGYNDTVGGNTIYVRLSDGADPDTKTSGHIQCSEPIQVIEAESGKETILLSFLISNYSTTSDANVWFFQVDALNAVLFKGVLDISATNSPFALDSKIVLEPGDKLLVMADIEGVAAITSGDAS